MRPLASAARSSSSTNDATSSRIRSAYAMSTCFAGNRESPVCGSRMHAKWSTWNGARDASATARSRANRALGLKSKPTTTWDCSLLMHHDAARGVPCFRAASSVTRDHAQHVERGHDPFEHAGLSYEHAMNVLVEHDASELVDRRVRRDHHELARHRIGRGDVAKSTARTACAGFELVAHDPREVECRD